MNITTDYFRFVSWSDQLEIDCMEVYPDTKPKGIVQFVHGMCEHKERYEDIMTFLAGHGYYCVIHDHRGHGKSIESQDDLGYFYDGGYVALIEDTHQLTCLTKEKVDMDIPYILLGHSMGSMIVRCYLKKYDDEIDKLIVLGSPSKVPGMRPVLAITKGLSKLEGEREHSKLLDYIVQNYMYESWFKEEGLHSWVCSDPDVVEEYNDDPYCNYTFTIQGYVNLIQLTEMTYDKDNWQVKNPDLPIFFASGSDDPCTLSPRDYGKAIHFLKDRGYTNVNATLFHGMRHELLNERNKDKVYKAILDFIEGKEE